MIPSDDTGRKLSRLFVRELEGKWADVYDELSDGYEFLAGRQYSAEIKTWREEHRTPSDVWNLVLPAFNRIMGDFLLSDKTPRVIARAGGDPSVAETIENILSTELANCRFKAETARALLAGLIKIGWMYVRYSDELQPDGSLVIDSVDPFEVLFDSRAKKTDLSDAKYIMRSKWLTVEDIKDLFPDFYKKNKTHFITIDESVYRDGEAEDDLEGDTAADYTANPNLVTRDGANKGLYRIVEVHEMHPGQVQVAVSDKAGDEQVISLEGKKLELFLAANPGTRIITQRRKKKTITTILPAWQVMVEVKDAEVQNEKYDLRPLFTYSYAPLVIDSFGLFANMKGPQQAFNNWRNAAHKQLLLAGGGDRKIKFSLLENPQEVEDGIGSPGLIWKVKAEANVNDVEKQEPPPHAPNAEMGMSETERIMFEMISGLPANMSGRQETAQENATLFAQRIEQASKGFTTLWLSLVQFMADVINIAIGMLQQYMTEARIYNYFDERSGESRQMALNMEIAGKIVNDLTTGEYEVRSAVMDVNADERFRRQWMKKEILQTIATLMPEQAAYILDFDWLLQDYDAGDVSQMLVRLKEVQAILQQQYTMGSAMSNKAGMLDVATKERDLMYPEGTPPQQQGNTATPRQAGRR